jgi:glycogen synthase
LAVAGRAPDAADARAVACRYGAVPVSEKTGAGIWNAFRKKDGFEFESADADGVRAAFREAAAWFRDKSKWAEIRARAMDNAHVTRA